MFSFDETTNILTISLPEGKTQAELVGLAKDEIKPLEKQFYGREVKLNGRLTTGMAIVLGHTLAHVCKSVSVFDPKENDYVLCIKH